MADHSLAAVVVIAKKMCRIHCLLCRKKSDRWIGQSLDLQLEWMQTTGTKEPETDVQMLVEVYDSPYLAVLDVLSSF